MYIKEKEKLEKFFDVIVFPPLRENKELSKKIFIVAVVLLVCAILFVCLKRDWNCILQPNVY